jgi:preprotein translocase subunit Sec63
MNPLFSTRTGSVLAIVISLFSMILLRAHTHATKRRRARLFIFFYLRGKQSVSDRDLRAKLREEGMRFSRHAFLTMMNELKAERLVTHEKRDGTDTHYYRLVSTSLHKPM